MLVGPVFSAGSMTSERERQTLELLLCTTVSPWQILSGKLYSGLRISCVLTSFLVWPLLLAWLLPPWTYWHDTPTILGYLGIIVLTSLTTTTLAMFCSVVLRQDLGEHDDHLPGADGAVCGAGGRQALRRHLLPRRQRSGGQIYARSSSPRSPARWPRPSACRLTVGSEARRGGRRDHLVDAYHARPSSPSTAC